MSDGNDTPKLMPPPRVTAAGQPESPAGPGRGPRAVEPRKRLVRVALVAVMIAGLIGVFFVLPRWQERRQNPVAPEQSQQLVEPSPSTPVPSPEVGPPPAEPTLVPSPTHTRRPAPIRPRPTPQRRLFEADRQYVEAMSAGLAALENRQWLAAQDAFARASRLRPDAPEVADGLARAQAGQRRETVAVNLQQALKLEQNEAWSEAEKLYGTVLATDPESAAALAGHERTRTRADLDEKLEFHLANPVRLSTADVFEDASTYLEEASEITPRGPRLDSQITRLEAALERASTPVAVVLESDAQTDVVVYRVGRLGSFTRRELKLTPGAYTVVGSRSGYRDVRLQLVVTPDSPPKPLVVRCTESL